MGSKKRAAWSRQKAEFAAQLGGGMDDLFAREEARNDQAEREREEALREKACESKNRYATRAEGEAAIASCAAHGTRGLHCYRCDYCGGWHLTSKPQP